MSRKQWVRAAAVSDFDGLPPEMPSLAVEVGRLRPGYFQTARRLGRTWMTLAPMEYSRLSDGEVWDFRVYCEKHGSSFDCRTGEVRGLPATEDVPAFEVEERDGEVWVALPV